jgi:hypothetical protein
MQTVFTCPVTGDEISFELPGDQTTMKVLWSHSVALSCPCCSGTHAIAYKEAYIAGTFEAAGCLPADVVGARLQ